MLFLLHVLNAISPAGGQFVMAQVCPTALPNAQGPIDKLKGYGIWVVMALLIIAVLAGIIMLLMGKSLGMHSLGQGGIAVLVLAVVGAILLLVMPGTVMGMVGNGCINV